jgi:hypothetical protein
MVKEKDAQKEAINPHANPRPPFCVTSTLFYSVIISGLA